MRPRISIRGSVRPSIGPSVRPSVGHTFSINEKIELYLSHFVGPSVCRSLCWPVSLSIQRFLFCILSCPNNDQFITDGRTDGQMLICISTDRHLYKRACPSVAQLVGRSVCNDFVKIAENGVMQHEDAAYVV